ncbi:hypothetical protein QZH41_008505, partial [Actinostola sp. cb2023]
IFHLSQTTIANKSTGYIINLVSGDVQRFDPVASQMALFFQGIFEVGAVSTLLAYVVGPQALSGALFLFFLVFYFCGMGKVCVYLRNKIAKIADQRLGFMSAIIAGARTVKMYAWERPFWDRLTSIRSQEIRYLKFKGIMLSTSQTFLYTAQSFAAFISLLVLVLTGVQLNTFNIFMTLAFLNTLRTSVSWNIAEGANYIGDFISALVRIEHFLELPELTNVKQEGNLTREILDKGPPARIVLDTNLNAIDNNGLSSTKSTPVSLENVTCYWNGESSPCIRNVSLDLKENDLVLITGPVGCGKTSLLSTILGELPVKEGTMSITGRTVYVPQQPWVFSGTVKENIIFGQKYKHAKYLSVIKACDLERDIASFPNSDLTLIGEKVCLLSGGQRARVGLARALYTDGDVYLLDDPLSAVDAKVGRHIFMECICGILRNKTRVLVTHQLQYLKGADHVVVMDTGTLAYEGTYEGLSKESNTKFEFLPGKYDDSPPLTRVLDARCLSIVSFKDKKQKGLEVADEDRVAGSVSWDLYWKYLLYGLPSVMVVMLTLYFLITQGALIFPDWWLLHISRLPRDKRNNLSNLYIYGGMVVMAFVMAVSRAVLFFFATLNSSKNLHDAMAKAVMKAPVLFFDTNPAGRIMNRFSRDIGVMDDLLPLVFLDALQLMLFCIGAIILPSILNPWVAIAALPMAILFFLIGSLALSLIYTLQLAVDTSQYGVRQCSETENYMTSVERVMTYTQIESEPGYDTQAVPPSDWPTSGQLELQDVSLEYYPGAPMVLNHVNFKVDAQEKIGIAGRTGAGKSSIVSALFRMPEPQGRILIDGIDIMTINLQSSRRAMAVISQDPVLFSGTLRFNLDPFEEYSDNEVWEAIDGASMTSTIQDMPNRLNQKLKEYGVNLSAGERQLLCLARALLQKSKIIVMDEATANVDYATDSLIQNTIRTKFKECTVITIAHRLNTIMDYDKILLLENGRVIDFDTPQALIAKDHGILTQLLMSFSQKEADTLQV